MATMDEGLSGPGTQDDDVKALRTYQSDIADAMKNKQGSIVKIAVAEHERKQKDRDESDPTTGKNKVFIILGTIFVILGIGTLGYFLWQKENKKTFLAPIIRNIPSGNIKTDDVKELDVTDMRPGEIKAAIAKLYKESTPEQTKILRIILTETVGGKKQIITTPRLFELLEANATPALVRAFITEGYTIGIYGGSSPSLFILLKNNSYSNAFSGMLSWERSMVDDLGDLFAIKTTGDQIGINTRSFKDKVVYNQDTRLVVDKDGGTVLIYTFLGEKKDLLLVTDKDETVGAIIDRLTGVTVKR